MRYWEPVDEFRVRGWVLLSRMDYVRSRWGEAVLQELLSRLTPEEQTQWRQASVNDWYELRFVERFERLIAEYAGEDPDAVYEAMGVFSAERAFHPEKGQYRRFLGKPPELFLKLAATWQNEYYNAGLTEYYPTGVSSCMIRTRYIPYTTRPNCRSNLGFFRRSIEILGGQDVRAEERRCLLQGDAWCEFYFAWQ